MAKTEMLLIPIEEVAAKAGAVPSGIQTWTSMLGVEVRRDWAGRECVAEPDARKIVEAVAEAGKQSAELHAAQQRYLEDWDRRQQQAGEEAFQAFSSRPSSSSTLSSFRTDMPSTAGGTCSLSP